MRDPSPDLVEIRAILADIRKDDQRAGHVIDRMRRMLKTNKLDSQALEVTELVSDVVAMVRADAVARQSQLEIDVPECLPQVCGDRVQLQQVLLNLILNGMDSLNGANRDNRLVRLSARLDEARTIEITVSDTARVYPRKSSTKSLIRFSLRRRMAWAWAFRSRAPLLRRTADGFGPRTEAAAERCSDSPFPSQMDAFRYDCRQANVHIVDDDASFLAAISRLLRASGFEVRTFSSAADFLEQREDGAPGCVVADLQMPGMSGFDLQSVLAQTSNPLPILFLTGHGDVPSSVRAMRGGAEDFLEKRVQKEKVVEAVRRCLERDANERRSRTQVHELRARFDALSTRELEVLSHVVQGRLNKQIADDLSIHERTVKLHRTAITTKLGVSSVAELTRVTLQAGIFPPVKQTFPKGQ